MDLRSYGLEKEADGRTLQLLSTVLYRTSRAFCSGVNKLALASNIVHVGSAEVLYRINQHFTVMADSH